MQRRPASRRARQPRGCLAFVVALLAAGSLARVSDATATDNEPALQRRQQLVRLVRQDCGSCHGLQLTGGLGPALTPAALRDWPTDSLAATILHGRPGTPMPPWKSFVTEDEANWIARRLREGFPQEASPPR
jgi:cytochrome c55X